MLKNNGEWKIKPKEFPSAKAFKFICGNYEVIFDYVMLKLSKIEDNKLILSNDSQKMDINLVISLDYNEKNNKN